MDLDFESQSHELLTKIQEQHTSLLHLDSQFQTIKHLIIVKPCGSLSCSLNKKQNRKNIAFKQSTRKNVLLFEYKEREFLASQQRKILQSRICRKTIRRAQNQHQPKKNLPRSKAVSGIPIDMTSVFNI